MDGAIYSLVVIVMLVIFLIMSYQFFRTVEKSNILYLGPGNQKITLNGNNLPPSVYANEYTLSTFVYVRPDSFNESTQVSTQVSIYEKGLISASFKNKTNTLSIVNNVKCDVENAPIGRWFHLAVVVRDMAVDVYIDSKLRRHCIYTKGSIDQLNPSEEIIINKNTNIEIAKFQYFSTALSSSEVRDLYESGPTPGITDSFSQMLKGILIEDNMKSMEDYAVEKCSLVKK